MLIGVAVNGKEIADHFGHCEAFELYKIDDQKIIEVNKIDNPGHRPGFLPAFLAENGINMIIAGGMGKSAMDLFKEHNIEVITGLKGMGKDAVADYLSGKLAIKAQPCRPETK